jgi:Ser/Thr protein kinase RdoA (MazF antagonist)
MELHRFVESAVGNVRGIPAQLVRLERKLSDYHSSFAIEELSAVFADEPRLELIFKNLSSHGLLDNALQIRPCFEYEPSREILVYRDILSDAGLGTATCYGAWIDFEKPRYWLLLEKVVGDELYKIGEFSIWCEAARWLAKMHRKLASFVEPYQRGSRILRHDAAYYQGWIERALEIVEKRENLPRKTNTRPESQWLEDQCRLAIRHICELPVAIIHGEFYPSNILIRPPGYPIRICPIDWETAAIGPALIDLAALIGGNWTEQQKQELAIAYYEALSPEIATWGNLQDFAKALQSCELLLAMKWLGWSSNWQPPPEHRFDWFAEAMRLARAIEAHQK